MSRFTTDEQGAGTQVLWVLFGYKPGWVKGHIFGTVLCGSSKKVIISFSLHSGRAAANFGIINVYSLGAHSKNIGALVIAELLRRFCVEMKFPEIHLHHQNPSLPSWATLSSLKFLSGFFTRCYFYPAQRNKFIKEISICSSLILCM